MNIFDFMIVSVKQRSQKVKQKPIREKLGNFREKQSSFGNLQPTRSVFGMNGFILMGYKILSQEFLKFWFFGIL